YARSSNYWKNSIGMVRGLKNLKVADKKRAQEEAFTQWVNQTPERQAEYGKALEAKKNYIEKTAKAQNIYQHLSEAFATSVEILGFSYNAMAMLKKNTPVADIKAKFAELYKDFNLETDRKIAKRMFKIIEDRLPEGDLPTIYETIKGYENIDAFVDEMYNNSVMASYESFCAALESGEDVYAKLSAELAGKASISIWKSIIDNNKVVREMTAEKNRGHRLFIKGWIEMNPDKMPYPDANLTMRITYGQVLPYSPRDGVDYHYFTTLKGVMEKENPENPVDFTVEPRLKELYQNKDYGRYGVKGEMPVAFLSNNDITGGNSGSPVINGKGELIGIAFDGNWEAMSGDVAFEPELQRTISVDIRYVLFNIDKFAGAGHLVEEMTLVE
ncbi:MAG: S46 family peptidase, partial [Rikenellaceae bacterium]|nr:S46 family peptidase [Rikenellaceae bacterium]